MSDNMRHYTGGFVPAYNQRPGGKQMKKDARKEIQEQLDDHEDLLDEIERDLDDFEYDDLEE